MLSLKNLNFAPVPKNTHDPLLNKRNKLISRLQDQKALFNDPLYYSVSHRWDVSPDGTRNLVEHKTRVRPWWRQDITGKIHLVVRYGQKCPGSAPVGQKFGLKRGGFLAHRSP